MTTDRSPQLTDRLSGPAWLRRFDPAYFVREDVASGWVTDKHRAHRTPTQVVSWIDAACGVTVMACRIEWPDAVPRIAADVGLPMSRPLRFAPHARTLTPWSTDVASGMVRFVTGSMQYISIRHAYFWEAKRDGVTRWTGISPHRPVFGYGPGPEVLVVIAPLRSV